MISYQEHSNCPAFKISAPSTEQLELLQAPSPFGTYYMVSINLFQ